MFVQYFGVVERPFAEVEARLVRMGDGLGDSAAVAYRRGEDLLASIVGPGGIAKTVQLEVGEPLRGESRVSLPLSWTATGPSGLFPTMRADLTITSMGPSLTQVAFQGSYTPPLGLVGRVLDRAVLHRFAELSVKDFVDRVVSALVEIVPAD
jgi:hypothetical protein